MSKSSLTDYYRKLHLEMKKYGKPAGPERIDVIFIGTVPNAYRIKTRLNFLQGKPLTRDPSHLRFFNYNMLRKVLFKYFDSAKIIPLSGHIIGNRDFGIPVTENTPLWLGKLFSGGFFWKAMKER